MIRIYTAGNSAEAHLICHALEEEGIATVIQGNDSLQGIGQPITVSIKNAGDEGRAREILKDMAAQPGGMDEEHGAETGGKKKKSRFVHGVIAGVLIGVAVSHFYAMKTEQPEMPGSYDRNGDGREDAWFEYRGEEAVTQLYDENYDGDVDTWCYYDGGLPVKMETDRNRDGSPDEWVLYNLSGDVREVQHDMNFDGKPDYWEYHDSGAPISYTSDNDRDGTVDEWGDIEGGRIIERRWSYYNDDVIDKIARYGGGRKEKESYDRNRDGVYEEIVNYDEFERVVRE